MAQMIQGAFLDTGVLEDLGSRRVLGFGLAASCSIASEQGQARYAKGSSVWLG